MQQNTSYEDIINEFCHYKISWEGCVNLNISINIGWNVLEKYVGLRIFLCK